MHGGLSGGENLFLEKFLELAEDELKKMQLSMHIRSSPDDSEAFELLFLLLSRHKSPDGQPEQLDLDVVRHPFAIHLLKHGSRYIPSHFTFYF